MRLAYAVCVAVHWCCVQCSRYAASRLEIALVFDTSQPFADHEVGLNTRGASTRACALNGFSASPGMPSVLQAASGSPFIGCSAATQRIAINPKNNQCVCRLYEEEVRLCNARGGIDENSLRAFTLSMKGTPLLLGRGAACADDVRWRLQGRPDLVV